MKDKAFIRVLIIVLAIFIVLSVYQLCIIRNLESNLEEVSADRDRVIEKYNNQEK